MIEEFYKVLSTLYYISHLSCQRQLTTKWKLGLRDDPYWTSKKNSLELIKLSIINKVSLV
jgi:hypothetical protein